MRKRLVTLAMAALIAGCSTILLDPSASHVRIVYGATFTSDCRFIADIVGSDGHWYNFLFIGNNELSLAAINDLKNQTDTLGGNTTMVINNREFGTSVTLLGQAFHCDTPR